MVLNLGRRRPSRRLLLIIAVAAVLVLLLRGLPTASRHARYNGVPFRRSGTDWSRVQPRHPVDAVRPLPRGAPRRLPAVQHDFSRDAPNPAADALQAKRRDAVVAAFRKSWAAYRREAWLWDELRPVAGGGKTTFGGYAATLVDALDTLHIMGLQPEFDEALRAVAQLDWANSTAKAINFFETTIRHLGGLLSAHDLSGQPALLAKALELGHLLYAGLDTPTRMPVFWLDFDAARTGWQGGAGTHQAAAAGCSFSLEFTRLAQLTGEAKFYDAADRAKDFLHKLQNETRIPGLWPSYLDFASGAAPDGLFTLGAQSDSLYEYLPKMHALLGGQDKAYIEMTVQALDAARAHLLFRPMTPDHADVLLAGDAHAGPPDRAPAKVAKMQHLSCFAGGMYALAGKLLRRDDWVHVAERLTRGCTWAYDAFPTGIMPESMMLFACETKDLALCHYDRERILKLADAGVTEGVKTVLDRRYLLRPEAVESLFYMFRVTGRDEFRDAAWRMFEAVTRATETEKAYSAIRDVAAAGETHKTDSMESFWLSETLKYFYLIFSPPDVLSLDEWVFNTEAHPFRRPAGQTP